MYYEPDYHCKCCGATIDDDNCSEDGLTCVDCEAENSKAQELIDAHWQRKLFGESTDPSVRWWHYRKALRSGNLPCHQEEQAVSDRAFLDRLHAG